MNLESLANELLIDLFDYFDGTDLLYAFYGLNLRFNNLLYKQYRTFHFNFKSITERRFNMMCQQHLPLIADRIITLTLSNDDDTPQQINLLFSYIPSINQFIHLRSLTLYRVDYTTLIKIIDQCRQLCYLTRLKLASCTNAFIDSRQRQAIADNIWNLLKLINCETDVTSYSNEKDFRMPTNTSWSLKSLFLRQERLELREINQLLEYTPHLKHFSTGVYASHNDYHPCLLPTLTSFNIYVFDKSDISKIICLLQNMPNLYCLNVHLSSNTINGYHWEQLIVNHLHKLKKFHLEMSDRLDSNEILEDRMNELIDSFRVSFWIDEHQWFVRCFGYDATFYLYTSSIKIPFRLKMFPDLFMSTDPDDDLQDFCNDIITIHAYTFFDHPIPSHIRLTNIQDLEIKFPINDQFWTIVPNLNQLHSVTVHANRDTSQLQLQTLLDRAPHLYKLEICCKRLLNSVSAERLKMELLQSTNPSVRHLVMHQFAPFLNEEKCMAFINSSLATQCERLSIAVNNCESILNLVCNMKNLRVLDVVCEELIHPNRSPPIETVHESGNKTILNVNEIIPWLKEHLPSSCSIVRVPYCNYEIQIWIDNDNDNPL